MLDNSSPQEGKSITATSPLMTANRSQNCGDCGDVAVMFFEFAVILYLTISIV